MKSTPRFSFLYDSTAIWRERVRRRTLLGSFGCAIFALLLCLGSSSVRAYVMEGPSWSVSPVTFQLGLGNAGRTLADGNTSWNTAASPAMDMWDQKIQRAQLVGVTNPSAPVSSGDGVNSIVFSNTVFGSSFGSGTLAVTYYLYSNSRMVEADILFNTAQSWDSYRDRKST